MAVELGQWRDQAQKESIARQNIEVQLKQSQTDLCTAQRRLNIFQHNNHELFSKSKHLKRRMYEYEEGFNNAFSLLQKLSSASRSARKGWVEE